jgi:hypothetical protein
MEFVCLFVYNKSIIIIIIIKQTGSRFSSEARHFSQHNVNLLSNGFQAYFAINLVMFRRNLLPPSSGSKSQIPFTRLLSILQSSRPYSDHRPGHVSQQPMGTVTVAGAVPSSSL